jgi:hypothetical protein
MLGGKNLVPMVSGFVISSLGWNWVFWILTIVVGMNFILMFLFVPETWWDRAPTPPDKRSIRETELAREARASSLRSRPSSIAIARSQSVSSVPQVAIPDLSSGPTRPSVSSHVQKDSGSPRAAKIPNNLSCETSQSIAATGNVDNAAHVGGGEDPDTAALGAVPEVAAPEVAAVRAKLVRRPTFALDDVQDEQQVDNTPIGSIGRRSSNASMDFDPTEQTHRYMRPHIRRSATAGSELNPKKTYYELLKVFNGRFTKDKWWMVALRPFLLFAYPSVLFSTFIYSFSVVWLIVISETISGIMSKPPYNFKVTSVGLLYISTFIGGCLGSAVAGRVSDLVVRGMSRRNNGTYEPEFRLVMIIPVLVTICIGMMGFGWSSYEEDMWIVPAMFLAVIGFGCSLGSTTAITYAVDSYKMFAAESLVTLNMTKNTIGFLFSLFVPEFVNAKGSKDAFVVFGCIEIFLCLWAIPLYFYGKRLRHWTDCANFMRYLYVDNDDDTLEDNNS